MDFKELQKVNDQLGTMDIKGKNYVLVNERVKAFRYLFPEGTIETFLLSDVNGVCTFKAVARNGDQVLATGHAQEKEASSYINKTSYIENCETSAVGRALGFLGIGIDTSIASAEEVETAINNQEINKVAEVWIGKTKAKALAEILKEKGVTSEFVSSLYKVENLSKLTEKQHRNIMDNMDKLIQTYQKTTGGES